MEDKGEFAKTQTIFFTRCWSLLRLLRFEIVFNEQDIPWTPEVSYLGMTLKRD
jgi:hypothetical protein